MRGRLTRIALSLPMLIIAGLFALYLIFGFFLVDPLAQNLLPWVGDTQLDSKLSAKQVSFNPLTLEATVDGFNLAETSGAPLASFDRLYVNLETTGLFRWAWRIQDIQLKGPRATVEVRPGGKLNWAALIAKLSEDKKPPSDTMPRLLIEHIKIENGDIEYADANRPGKPFKASLQPLGIELDGLSTLPEDRGDYLISAKLPEQGGTLKWKGDVALNPVASQGELGLEGVRLGNLLRVIKSPRNYELPSGSLAASLKYRFAMVSNQADEAVPWLQISDASLLVKNLAVAPRGGGPSVLELAEARISNASLDLSKRQVEVAALSLTGARLAATRDVKGTLDWQTLFAAADATEPKPKAAAGAAAALPWKIDVREIMLADWAARYTDRGLAAPLGVMVKGLGLTAALTGEVGDTADIAIGPVNATLGPITVQSGTQPVAELQRAALVNAEYALADKRLLIEAIELNGAKTTAVLDKNHVLNWTDILKKAPGAPEAAPAKADTATDSPVNVHLARLKLDGIEIGITDQSPNAPVRLDVMKGFVTLSDLSLDRDKAIPLEAGFALRQGGRFNASGTVIPGESSGRLDLKLAGLSLKPFAPYVNQFAKLILRSGAASSQGKLIFSQSGSGMKLDFGGGFAVDDLAITEEETEEAFLGWKKLSSSSLRLNLGPDRLRMKDLVAQNPFGKVIIFEDKSINLQRVMRTPASGKSKANVAAPAQSTSAGKPAAFPLDIERLRIVGANAEFADLSLKPQFGTRMHDLGGVVTGLSTNPEATAQVELDGKVDKFGSARVRGTIQPFQATEFTDLKLTFRNLEMANMTPYSGKFAGRKIDSGKLSVDLEYKIKQRQLAGENKFVINRIKLGERIDSPEAMKLPLDLAIALLEDSNGVIDLDLPITGSLDDPQFSYGKIVWKAIVNVLTKLVTAPFRVLGKLLGVSAEKMESVGFDPGSSMLLPPEQEKLKTLAEAMAKRPALTLAIEPGYDLASDREALQEQAMRREVAAGTGIKFAPDEAPGPVDINLYKVQTLLEDLYAERVGKAEYQSVRARFREKGPDGKPAGVDIELLERFGRNFKTRDTGPASALHTELLEQLTRKIAIDDATLTKLAQARGQVMRDALVKLGLSAERVSVAAPVEQAVKDNQVGSKMNLGAGLAGAATPPGSVPTPASAPVVPVAP